MPRGRSGRVEAMTSRPWSSRSASAVAAVAVLTGCSPSSDPASTSTLTSSPPSAQATVVPELVLAHQDLDAAYVLPGTAIEHGGVHHLWVVLFDSDPEAPPRVVHLTSSDGRAWDGDTQISVLDGAAIGLDRVGPVPSSVLVGADGGWRMYGSGRLAQTKTPIVWTASAPGPDGPWTVAPEPALRPSGDGWDGSITDHPSVVATEDGYLMAYGGASGSAPNRNRIGFARSTDGLTWERTPAAMDAADDPDALGPSACGIDARSMVEPELRSADEGYRLSFGIFEATANTMVIGAAVSADGESWTCVRDGPFAASRDLEGAPGIHSFLSLRIDGREWLLVEVLAEDSAASDLWLVEPID